MTPPSPSPSLRGGGTEMDAAQRALAPGPERASEMQGGLGALGLWPRSSHSWLRLACSSPGPLGLGGQCFSCQRFPSPWASVAQPSSSKRKRRRGGTGAKWVRGEDGGETGGEDGSHSHPTSPSQRAAAGPGTEAQGLHPSSTLCVVSGPCGGRGRCGLLQGSRLGGWDPRRLGSEATG